MAKYRGRTVTLNKPFRTSGERKKFGVYVRNKKTGNVQVVRFGDPTMRIKKNNPERQKSFLERDGSTLKRMRAKGRQNNLQPVFWALKSWRKGFDV